MNHKWTLKNEQILILFKTMWHKENELYFKEVLQTLKKTWETFYDKNSEIERNFFFYDWCFGVTAISW